MAITCRDVWREVSNYIDNDISPQAREEFERHLAHCRHCTAIVDGVHNVIILMADSRLFALPAGFSERMRARLDQELRVPGKPASERSMMQRAMEINFHERKKDRSN